MVVSLISVVSLESQRQASSYPPYIEVVRVRTGGGCSHLKRNKAMISVLWHQIGGHLPFLYQRTRVYTEA